jgi:nitroreductase
MNHPFEQEIKEYRTANYPIHSVLLNRWSPRSMTGESLSDQEVFSLFEAARWAPSSYNEQPWRFLYATRNSPEWPLFFNLMIDFNKSWTQNAALLGVMTSHRVFEKNGKESPTHHFDTGAAWMALAIEGSSRGLVVHGMSGFDYELARKTLEVPADYQVLAMFAVGKRAPASELSPELREKEKPSSRKPLELVMKKGKF